jgi:hypothetical protein
MGLRISDVVNKLLWIALLHYDERTKPGAIIERFLNPKERELLKEVKSKDFYHRIK